MRRVIDMIQMSNGMLGVMYVRPVKHETRAGRPKFVVSGKYPTMTKPLVKARAYFTSTKIHVRRKGALRDAAGRVAWPPDAESVRHCWGRLASLVRGQSADERRVEYKVLLKARYPPTAVRAVLWDLLRTSSLEDLPFRTYLGHSHLGISVSCGVI